jgi:thiamine-phosphate pyrophosphorylase
MASSEIVPQQTLRMIDASLNRISEGLRFLEDIARLLLNEGTLTQQLKTMRHELVRSDWSFHQQLLLARNSASDVGANLEVEGEEKERAIPVMVMANSRRVQEALRTMEELTKIPGGIPRLDSEKFKQARFCLYTIEQTLLSKLLRQDKMKQITGVYVILDTMALKGRSHVEAAAQTIRGGAKVIQLRDKLLNKKELLPIAQELKKLCIEHKVLFIINDHLDLVLATDADGLHLGQSDLPINVARKLLPIGKILGISTTTVDQAVVAETQGVDYIAIGSIYPTLSKETTQLVGLNRLSQIRHAITLPLVAIGGITWDNVHNVLTAGANSVAIISAILWAEDIETATRQIADKLETHHEEINR